MIKKINKNPYKNLILLTALLFSINLQAKRYWFNDEDQDIFDDFREAYQKMINEMKELQNNFFNHISNSDVKEKKQDTNHNNLIKEAKKLIDSIEPEISKDQGGIVTISFNLENPDIDKDSLDELIQEGNKLKGSIKTKYGNVDFYILPKYINIVKNIAIKESNESDSKDKNQNYNKYVYRYTYSYTESLPLTVDLSSSTAEIKNNKLIIKLNSRNYQKIKINK